MENRNIFIITSTINTNIGNIHSGTRFEETVKTINSIRTKDRNAIILLIDNSTIRIDTRFEEYIASMVDFYLYIGDRSICREFNKAGIRSAGEAYILLVAIEIIRTKITGNINRIFKLSGRYNLTNEFDISEYAGDLYKGKYCFRQNDSQDDKCYHTRLWSFCYSLIDEATILIHNSLKMIFKNQINIEECFFTLIDKEMITLKEKIHCEGFPALWHNVHISE